MKEATTRVSRAVMTMDEGSIWCLAGASDDRGGSSCGIKWIMVAAVLSSWAYFCGLITATVLRVVLVPIVFPCVSLLPY